MAALSLTGLGVISYVTHKSAAPRNDRPQVGFAVIGSDANVRMDQFSNLISHIEKSGSNIPNEGLSREEIDEITTDLMWAKGGYERMSELLATLRKVNADPKIIEKVSRKTLDSFRVKLSLRGRFARQGEIVLPDDMVEYTRMVASYLNEFPEDDHLDIVLSSLLGIYSMPEVQLKLLESVLEGVTAERPAQIIHGVMWQVHHRRQPVDMFIGDFDASRFRGQPLLIVFLPDDPIRWQALVMELKPLARKRESKHFELVTLGPSLDDLNQFWNHYELSNPDQLFDFGISERPVYMLLGEDGKFKAIEKSLKLISNPLDGLVMPLQASRLQRDE